MKEQKGLSDRSKLYGAKKNIEAVINEFDALCKLSSDTKGNFHDFENIRAEVAESIHAMFQDYREKKRIE